MRITDVFLSLPAPVLAIAVVAAIGPSLFAHADRGLDHVVALLRAVGAGRGARGSPPARTSRPPDSPAPAGCGGSSRHLLPGAVPTGDRRREPRPRRRDRSAREPVVPRARRPAPGAGARQHDRHRRDRPAHVPGGSPLIPGLLVFVLCLVANVAGDVPARPDGPLMGPSSLRRLAAMAASFCSLSTAVIFMLQKVSPFDPVRLAVGPEASRRSSLRPGGGSATTIRSSCSTCTTSARRRPATSAPRCAPANPVAQTSALPSGSLELDARRARDCDAAGAAVRHRQRRALARRGCSASGTITFASAPLVRAQRAVCTAVLLSTRTGFRPAGEARYSNAPTGPTGLLDDRWAAPRPPAVSWTRCAISSSRRSRSRCFRRSRSAACCVARLITNIRADHVRAARSRGLSETALVLRHCLRNSAGRRLRWRD